MSDARATKFYVFCEHENHLHQVFLTDREEHNLKLFLAQLVEQPLRVSEKPIGELLREQSDD